MQSYNIDPTQLVGKTLEEGKVYAESQGCTIRVTSKDGEGMMVTMDFRPNRINVSIVKNVITGVGKMG